MLVNRRSCCIDMRRTKDGDYKVSTVAMTNHFLISIFSVLIMTLYVCKLVGLCNYCAIYATVIKNKLFVASELLY